MTLKISSNLRSLAQFKLVPHLEKACGEGDFEWTYDYKPKEIDDGWHPSSSCTPSLTELYLSAKGELEEKKPSASLYRTFGVGHYFHQYFQHILWAKLNFCEFEAIERHGVKSWGEKMDCRACKGTGQLNIGTINPIVNLPCWPCDGTGEVSTPYHYVSGSADVAPLVIPTHGEYLLDIKTMNSHDFRSQELPTWVAAKYECQLNIYLDLFDMERAMILGVQKDSPHALKEFTFTKNQPLIDAIYLKWKIVSECLESGVMPPEDEEIELPLSGPD